MKHCTYIIQSAPHPSFTVKAAHYVCSSEFSTNNTVRLHMCMYVCTIHTVIVVDIKSSNTV